MARSGFVPRLSHDGTFTQTVAAIQARRAIESLFPELYGPVQERRRLKVRIHIETALVHFGAAHAPVLHTY